jgi:MFS family permease
MTSALHFNFLRFVLGAAEAGLFPGMLLYLTYWVPTQRRARFTALFMASIPIAGVVGGPLAGAIMSGFEGVAGLHGWQWVFLIEGVPAILLGFVAYRYLDDLPRDAAWLGAEEKALIAADLAAEQHGKSPAAHGSMRQAFADPRMYALGALGFAIMVSTGGLFLWLPTILRKSGVQGVFEIGLLSAIPFAIGCIAQYLNARHSDRTQERRWHAVVPSLIAAVGWALLPSVADDTLPAMLVLCLATLGTLAAMGPFWSLPPTLLKGGAAAGGIAMISTIAAAGNFISPIFVGWLSDTTGSLAIGQYYFALLFAVGTMLMLLGVKARPAVLQAGVH